MPANALGAGVADEVQWVRGSRVLGQRAVIEVGYPRRALEDDIFEHGAETEAGVVDIGLGFG